MKSKKFILGAMIVLAFGLVATIIWASSRSEPEEPIIDQAPISQEETDTQDSNAITVDNTADKLRAAGITLGEETEAEFEAINAIDGAKYGIGTDNAVEIYLYDDPDEQALAEESLESPDKTIITYGEIMLLIYSVDPTVVEQYEAALRG